MSDNTGLLGHLAVKKGLITREQLRMATLEQARHPDKRIGEILVGLGLIDEAQLESLLAAQRGLQSRLQRNRRPTPPPSKRGVDPVALGSIALKRVPRSVAKGGTPKREAEGPPEVAASTTSADEGGAVKTVGFAMPRPKESRKEPDTRRWLLSILGDAIECGASDVLFRPDEPVRVRRFGRLQDLTQGPVPARATEPLLDELLEETERAALERTGHVRTVYQHLEVGRFRLDVFRHRQGVGGVFHRVPREPPSIADLGLPSVLAGLANFGRGLVVIVGPRGAGKSSTLTALLDLVNAERSDHVLTIEDTVECVISSRVANVSQLQVGRDVATRLAAMRRAHVEDPDVVAIDALQTDEELREAIQLAESGHLVFATLACPSSVRAIERFVDAYDSDRTTACRRVADSLKAVIYQRILPSSGDRGAVAVVEIVHVGTSISAAIRDGAIAKIPAMIDAGHSRGSILIDEALARLVRGGVLAAETAAHLAHHPQKFRP